MWIKGVIIVRAEAVGIGKSMGSEKQSHLSLGFSQHFAVR